MKPPSEKEDEVIMNTAERMKMLERPKLPADVALDTDTYNEVDDQFALSYLLRLAPALNVRALFAAPFYNSNSSGPADGMEKSYGEICHILRLAGREDLLPVTYRGSERYLPDEKTPVRSPAAERLAALGMEYSPERPLYVVAIGAITNVASALLMNPEIRNRIVVVWLGGHALDWPDTREFNMCQDIAAARIVFGCGVPLVQLPCMGGVSGLAVSEADLQKWLYGKNDLCTYLVRHTCDAMRREEGKPWSRIIWDVTAVAWLLGPGFVADRLIPAPIPEYDCQYGFGPDRPPIKYAFWINRDALFRDLVEKLTK